jgi:hypothetical protein
MWQKVLGIAASNQMLRERRTRRSCTARLRAQTYE